MNWLFLLDEFSDTFMPLLPLSVGLFKRLYNKKPFGRVILLLSLAVITFGISNLLADRKINNIWIYNSYGLLECFMLLTIFGNRVQRNTFKIAMWISYIILFSSYIFVLFSNDTSFKRYSSVIILASVIEMAICLFFYMDLMLSFNTMYFSKYALFWFVTAFFVFSIGSIALEVCYWLYSGKFIVFTVKLWTINNILLMSIVRKEFLGKD